MAQLETSKHTNHVALKSEKIFAMERSFAYCINNFFSLLRKTKGEINQIAVQINVHKLTLSIFNLNLAHLSPK